jgi:hypothetical protein
MGCEMIDFILITMLIVGTALGVSLLFAELRQANRGAKSI